MLKSYSEESYDFLEKTIEDLSLQTIGIQEHFWREMFQKAFGFSVDSNPIDIK